jgi:hypothetical protein
MWNDRFRLPEAAEMTGVSFRFLRGWHERGLVKTAGIDASRFEHPYLMPSPGSEERIHNRLYIEYSYWI